MRTPAHTQNEEYCPGAKHNPLTGYEPKLLDDFHYSETFAAIFQDETVDIDTEPSYWCDAELDDEIIGKAPSSPLFIHEREEPADRRQAFTLMKKVCCQPSPFSHTQVRGDPYTNLVRLKNGKQVATWKTSESGFSLNEKKEQILAEVRTEIQKHEFQADSDRRSIQELTGIIDSQRREIDHTIASDEQSRRDQVLLHEQLSEQNRESS